MVRIMSTTHGIDIILFHQLYIFQHQLLAYRTTPARKLMPVYPLDQYGHSVYTKTPLLNLRSLKSHRTARRLYHTPLVILQIHDQSIKIRMLGTPRFHIGNHPLERNDAVLSLQRSLITRHDTVIGIAQLIIYCQFSLSVQASDMYVERKFAILILLPVKWRYDLIISDKLLGSTVKIHIPFYPAQPPHILAFQIRAGAPAVHLHRQDILTLLHFIRNIPFGRSLGTLVISQKLPVEPHIIKRRDPFETQNDAPPVPRIRYGKRTPVRPYFILLIRNQRRVLFETKHRVVKLVRLIHINRDTVFLALPVARNLYIIPISRIIIRTIKIRRTLVRITHPVKFPSPVQAHIIRRLLVILFTNAIYITVLIRPYIRMRFQLVQPDGILALPLRLFRFGMRPSER
ncbi:uncharacterized protein BN472_02396 [Tannerella sp. CAG:118]|nr:uncharacterized protein BN472_02396 [Tannerella sp. CAG:118]